MKHLFVCLTFTLISYFSFAQIESKFDLANQKLENGYYKEAIIDFSYLLEKGEQQFHHLFYYGRAYSNYKLGNSKLALNDLNEVFEIADSLRAATITKGNSYWLKALIISNGKPTKKAVKWLRKATEYIQTSLLYSTLGYDLIFLGKHTEAIQALNMAIELDSTNAWAYSNLALAFLRNNELAKAKTFIEKAIQLDSKNPFAYKHRAIISIEIGDFDNACNDLKLAKSLNLQQRMSASGLDEIENLMKKHCR